MDIALDKVCEFIIRAKAIDVKEGATDPDSGSNPIDDGNLNSLMESPDDATEQELRDVIAGLNDDERADLIALVYIGRGDMEPEEWGDAVRLAKEREDANSISTADWLIGIPISETFSTRGSPPWVGAACSHRPVSRRRRPRNWSCANRRRDSEVSASGICARCLKNSKVDVRAGRFAMRSRPGRCSSIAAIVATASVRPAAPS